MMSFSLGALRCSLEKHRSPVATPRLRGQRHDGKVEHKDQVYVVPEAAVPKDGNVVIFKRVYRDRIEGKDTPEGLALNEKRHLGLLSLGEALRRSDVFCCLTHLLSVEVRFDFDHGGHVVSRKDC